MAGTVATAQPECSQLCEELSVVYPECQCAHYACEAGLVLRIGQADA